MKDPFGDIEIKIKWSQKYDHILNALDKNIPVDGIEKPTTEKEKAWIINLLKEYMDHNREKNRDREGEEFYKRIENFISNL